MASRTTESKSPLITLGNALALVFDAIAVAQKGLLKNPTKEEGRELNERLVDLELKRAQIRAKLDALIAGSRRVSGPTADQVKEISTLTGQVEALKNESITASGAVALTARVLDVATRVASA